jgi:hypothetical protein
VSSFVATAIVTSSSSTMTASGLCAVPIMEPGILSIRRWHIPATRRPDNGPVSYCVVASNGWFARVSEHALPWLAIDDAVGPDSLRGYIERNTTDLLSNYRRPPLDPPSQDWLGLHCNRERVRSAVLWNSNHVDEQYEPAFLDVLERLVSAMGRAS